MIRIDLVSGNTIRCLGVRQDPQTHAIIADHVDGTQTVIYELDVRDITEYRPVPFGFTMSRP